MNKAALFHQAFGKWGYQSKADEFTAVLRTAKGDFEKVEVIFGDHFKWLSKKGASVSVTQFGGSGDMYWANEKKFAKKWMSDELFDYWKVTMWVKEKRLRYAFRCITSSGEEIFHTERGPITNSDNLQMDGFTWGYMDRGSMVNIPDWVSDTVWYQIFPERFANGDKSNDNEGTIYPWGSKEPTPQNYFGGDLRGIINNLEHIKELGCNGIYFTPIFKANTNHKYDTESYYEIDPHFGTEEEFQELLTKAHEKGLRIMLDAVFNHSGSKWAPWQDVLKNKEKSKYADWFFINNWDDVRPAETYLPNPDDYFKAHYPYETFSFTPFMPRLNWSNKDMTAHLMGAVEKWTKMGVDAWRIDVANEPSFEFWRTFRNTAKAIDQDAYLLGEIWYDSNPFLCGDQFDSVMNYPLRGTILEYLEGKIDTKKFVERLVDCQLMYSDVVQKGMFNLLGSHDTPRLLTLVNDNIEKLKLGYGMLFAFTGTPCVYYGDEIGINGANDPGCRKCMEWDSSKWNKDLHSFMKNLIKVRKSDESLKSGKFEFINYNEGKVVAFKKVSNNSETIVVINNHNESNTFKSSLGNMINLMTGEKVDASNFTLKPNEIAFLK